ncbi:hypothetical protein ACJIZ3_012918 [Penstemon smallii]|uniref:DUF1771 domain-containing protein n=1 Tax=Penstemon smallii TaxID=265156 RepID=A0ABD3UPZ0_9LAMI
MKEVLPSSTSYTDDDQNNLKQLLDTFGSMVSLEDIAAAYCRADRNICDTAEILCNKNGSTGESFTSKSQEDVESTSGTSSRCQSYNHLEDADDITELKQKRSSASMGTVAGLIGREYVTPRPQSNGSREMSKPVKLSSDEIPMNEIWDDKKELKSVSSNDSMENDMEEFLYKMLGNGFQLEKSVIQDVVGQCGYNIQMSVDKLLDMSAASLEKSDDVIGIASGNTMENSLGLEFTSCRGKSPVIDISERSNTNGHNKDEFILPRSEKKKKKKEKEDIQREVLESLFSVPDRIKEKQESTRPIFHPPRRSPYGRVVTKPLEDTIIEDFTFITRQPVNNRNDEANEIGYDDLRKAVMEYWITMKEYYKSAVDAFSRKDYKKAQKFMEEGNFFMKKAREADEKSAQKLIQDSEEEEEFCFNLHYFDPKEALVQMKLHLTSFSGLPSISYLKFVVGTKDGDTKDGRRKRVIIKLLEKEGIVWTEEGDGWIISIRVDEIDPENLSFANK